jgi:WD40 repeat protein
VALTPDGQVAASCSFDGTVKLWDTSTAVSLKTWRADRPYERMDITGLTGVTEAQRSALLALGAVDSCRVE